MPSNRLSKKFESTVKTLIRQRWPTMLVYKGRNRSGLLVVALHKPSCCTCSMLYHFQPINVFSPVWIRDLHGNGKLTHPHPLPQDFLSIPTHLPILNSPELITKADVMVTASRNNNLWTIVTAMIAVTLLQSLKLILTLNLSLNLTLTL